MGVSGNNNTDGVLSPGLVMTFHHLNRQALGGHTQVSPLTEAAKALCNLRRQLAQLQPACVWDPKCVTDG